MSELIDNKKKRREVLAKIIMKLHDGKTVEEVKEEFSKLIEGVSATEISEMEQELIANGMPVAEIQRLCDVHAAVFKGSIEEIHESDLSLEQIPGHPMHTFKRENRAIERHINKLLLPKIDEYTGSGDKEVKEALIEGFNKLHSIDRHYSRKENLIFPFMEKNNITAPPKVMWGVDDEIRHGIRDLINMLGSEELDLPDFKEKAKAVLTRVTEMVYKEENIMFPMIIDLLTFDDWAAIEQASAEIGFTMIEDVKRWNRSQAAMIPEKNEQAVQSDETKIMMDAGSLRRDEINAIFNTVPFDMTFVGADDRVKYFTQGRERIFDRPKTIIGREVKNCHPPSSVHIVEKIVESFKNGEKDHEDFWIDLKGSKIHIRYYAVRDKDGEYLGTLEVTQDISDIKRLEGERRIMD